MAEHTQEQTQELKHYTTRHLGVILVLIATLGLSVEGVAAKIAYQGGATVMTALVLRYAMAALIFWSSLMIWKVQFSLRKNVPYLLALGIVQALTVLSLFYSFKYIPAGLSILLLYLYPTLVTFMSYFFLNEPLSPGKFLALGLTLSGSAIIVGSPVENLDPKGIYFALLAAFLNAIYVVAGAKLVAEIPVRVFNTFTTTVIALFYIILGFVTHQLSFDLTAKAWFAVVILAVVCTVLATATFFRGIQRIGASRAAIISSIEPFATAVLAFLLLGELLTMWQVFGGIMVLAGVLLQRK